VGFGLPWALLGLLGMGIPLLVHLVRRRDLREMALPTLVLLRRAQAHSRRRMRLVDMLLLLARIALLALLALALAQPYYTVTLAWGDGSTASAAIVIDDSMSMTRTEGGETLLEQAFDKAEAAIESLPKGSEIALVYAGQPARVAMRRQPDLDAAQKVLADPPDHSARGSNLAEAVRLASRELRGGKHATRRLLVLSDFAQHSGVGQIEWPEGGIEVELERIGPDGTDPNQTVAETIVTPDPTSPGRASIRATVRQFPPTKESVTVRLMRGDEQLDRTKVSVSEGTGHATLHAPLKEGADPTASVRIDGQDSLPADDRRALLLRPPAAARVLLVNGDPGATARRDEVTFLSQALDAAPRERGSLRYRVVDADALNGQHLADSDVVVLANATAPSPQMAEQLHRFVEQGGGLLVTAGDRVDPRTYAARLGDLLPVHPGPASKASPALGLRRPEGASTPRGGLKKVQASKRLLLDDATPGARTFLEFEDGTPALVLDQRGDGRVALLGTTIDDDWTDFPYRPGFLPVMIHALRELSPVAHVPDQPVQPGTKVEVPVPPGAQSLRVLGPDGRSHDFDGEDLKKDSRMVPFEHTDHAGAYRVQMVTEGSALQDATRAAFVVAPPLEESDLTTGELPEVPSAEPGESATRGANVARRSLAPWLFLLAGLFAAVEALLRTRFAVRRPTV
jgi:hypothetical protein